MTILNPNAPQTQTAKLHIVLGLKCVTAFIPGESNCIQSELKQLRSFDHQSIYNWTLLEVELIQGLDLSFWCPS